MGRGIIHASRFGKLDANAGLSTVQIEARDDIQKDLDPEASGGADVRV